MTIALKLEEIQQMAEEFLMGRGAPLKVSLPYGENCVWDLRSELADFVKFILSGAARAAPPESVDRGMAMSTLDKQVENTISAAVEREREECAKIAEQYLDSAFCKESFYGQQVAAAIRSRTSQPVPDSATGASSPDASELLASASSPAKLAAILIGKMEDLAHRETSIAACKAIQACCKIIEEELNR